MGSQCERGGELNGEERRGGRGKERENDREAPGPVTQKSTGMVEFSSLLSAHTGDALTHMVPFAAYNLFIYVF